MRRIKQQLWSISAVVMSAVVLATAQTPAFAITSDPTSQPSSTTSKLGVIGDSISIGVNVRLSGPDSASSWSAGTDSSVASIRRRIEAAQGGAIASHFAARSGASSTTIVSQANSAVASGADTVTMLLGANDACKPSVSMMTPVSIYRSRVSDALDILEAANIKVVVASVPSLMELYETGRDSSRARYMWNRYAICASMLADPTSTSAADVERRAAVERRVQEFNSVLAAECVSRSGCAYDNGAVYGVQTGMADLSSLDYFHPSVNGQNKIAAAVWPTYQRLFPNSTQDAVSNGINSARGSSSVANATAGGADRTAPEILIMAPTNGSTVSGMVTVRAVASDDTEVTRVKFYSGRVLLGTAMRNGDEWVRSFSTTHLPNGTYPVTAKAYDAAGNEGVSPATRLVVSNAPENQSTGANVMSTISSRLKSFYEKIR